MKFGLLFITFDGLLIILYLRLRSIEAFQLLAIIVHFRTSNKVLLHYHNLLEGF